jgi:hypothetical protein
MAMSVGMVITLFRAAAIGARFRFEGASGEPDLQSESTQHVIEHMVVQIAYPSGFYLDGYVPSRTRSPVVGSYISA